MDTWRGAHVRRLRSLLRIKQDHLATLMNVTQTTVSRWESGAIRMSERQYEVALSVLRARSPGADRAIRRLVEGSSLSIHVICDWTHRLLAASPSRYGEWRLSPGDVIGRSLLRYASSEILSADEGLRERGWYDAPSSAVSIETGSNFRLDVPIPPSTVLWERLWLADGSAVRLVSTIQHEHVRA